MIAISKVEAEAISKVLMLQSAERKIRERRMNLPNVYSF